MTTTAPAHPVTTHTTEDAEERLVGILNDAALALMLSVGHRTGLLDTLADGRPRTAAQLAADADLAPRYVEEWLGAMTVGRIVDHDPATGTYRLPEPYGALLTRERPVDNIAAFMQYVAVLGAVEDDIVRCFREGGGVPYERFPRFQDVMAEDSGQSVLPALESHILPLVDGLPERLAAGARVADVGCGQGRALVHLAASFPASTFTGYDLSHDAVARGRALAAAEGLDNLRFVQLDAARLQEEVPAGSLDVVFTFDAVHDQAEPDAVLAGIRHALAEDGVYLAQDIDATSSHHGDLDHPLGPFLYTISTMHCMTVSLAAGGEGLGAMWGRERALERFARAGFSDVEVHTLDHDVQNAYYVCRP